VLEVAPQPDIASRPSRLPRSVEVLTVILLALSFITGGLFWLGQGRLQELDPPAWFNFCRIAHGCLNPFLCALFGYLLCQHIRYGWELKVNRPSGFAIEGIMAGLILSGVGLYYLGNETARNIVVWIHRVLGFVLPIGFVAHWLAARRWVKNFSK
jgi:uncharacterized membrane protein YfbV (UPF0208 family)